MDRRILIVSQSLGGVATHVIDLATGLESRGWDVIAACADRDWLAARLPESIDVVEIAMVREIHPSTDAMSFIRLARLCREVRPTVLHLHSSKAGFLGRIAGRMTRVPVVVFTPHCWSFQSAEGRRRRFYVGLEKLASRFCDMTVAVSQHESDEAISLGVVDPGHVVVIRNGVPSPKNGALPEHVEALLARGGRFVVSAGRLAEQKGYSHLIKAMELVKREQPLAKLLIAGDGGLSDELRAESRALGLDEAVYFVGELDDVGPLLERADVFVLSSLWEGLPYVILEAMSAGLPVVTTSVGGCPELVENNVSGLVVPPRQPEALAESILSLLGDEALRAKLGLAGRARAADEFSRERCIDENEAIYLRLISEKQARGGRREGGPS